MKKEILVVFIFCIAAMIGTAHSFTTESDKYTVTCSDNGNLVIRSPDIIDKSNAYKVDIKANLTEPGTSFNVPGTWVAGTFTSEEAIFNETGNYDIIISFQDQSDKVEKTIECPGLIFSCRLFSIDISRCYMYDGVFYAIFDARNLGKYDWNLNTDLTYIASDDKGKSTELDPISKLEQIEISKLESEIYRLEWTTERNIELFHLKASICKSTVSKICTEPQECVVDNDCLEFEYCDSYCRRLDCSESEYISDHRCISSCTTNKDCDDALACTTDRCQNSVCVHEPVICTTQETCTIGECKEPIGCIYKVDSDCKKSELDTTKAAASSTLDTETKEQQTSECTTTVTFLLLTITILVFYIIYITKKPDPKPVKKRKTK